MSEKKSGSYAIHITIIALAVLVAVVAYFALSNKVGNSIENSETTAATKTETETAKEPVQIDVNTILSERILGDPNAPIRISEHSSFTCPHCAEFHKTTFKQLKTNYIDTGKAYLVFMDFPLNAPAMHASITARCLPQNRYFEYVDMLFARQKEWAFDAEYLTFLKTTAAQYGLSAEKFEACIQSEEAQQGILKTMRDIQTKFAVNSTPSFVINNKEKISGALSFESFEKEIQEIVTGTSPIFND